MDGLAITTNYAGFLQLGLFFSGGTKLYRGRIHFMFDLDEAPAFGAAVNPGLITVTNAYLETDIIAAVTSGTPNLNATISRCRRYDWDGDLLTWVKYNATNWTTAGAQDTTNDIDTSSTVAYSLQTAAGAQTITGLTTLTQDAIASRGNEVNLRIKIDDDTTDDDEDRYNRYDPTLTYLCVEYTRRRFFLT